MKKNTAKTYCPEEIYAEKNESLLKIKDLFENSKYHGELVRRAEEDFDSYLFETKIADEPSWMIVRKYDRGGQCFIYSISDQASLLDHLKKPKENL